MSPIKPDSANVTPLRLLESLRVRAIAKQEEFKGKPMGLTYEGVVTGLDHALSALAAHETEVLDRIAKIDAALEEMDHDAEGDEVPAAQGYRNGLAVALGALTGRQP